MVIDACKEWVEEFVLKHNLCPFAHPFVRNGWVEYRVSVQVELEDRIMDFLSVLDELDEDDSPKTMLLIYDDPQLDFDAYLDFYELCEVSLEKENRAYQLASFHPNYCFADEQYDDPANLSNRSPYPMIHILRLEDVAQAVDAHKDPHGIPRRNISYLREHFSS